MTSNPKTIDNLGYSASRRYALDQQLLNGQDKIHHEAKLLFGESQINAARAPLHSELDNLLNHASNIPAWASFAPPPGYFEHKKRFFTHQLLPELSIQEHNESLAKKVGEKTKEQENHPEGRRAEWEEKQEEEQLEGEKAILLKLLNCILSLDNCMLYLSSKRSQYHKG